MNIPITFYTREKIGVGAWTPESLEASLAEWKDSRTGPRSSPWVAAGAHVRSRPDVEPDLQLYGAISPHRDYVRFLSSKPGITFAFYPAAAEKPWRDQIAFRRSDRISVDQSALFRFRSQWQRYRDPGRRRAHQPPDRGPIAAEAIDRARSRQASRPKAMRTLPTISAVTAPRSITPPRPAGWGPTRWPWSIPATSGFAGRRGCTWRTPR